MQYSLIATQALFGARRVTDSRKSNVYLQLQAATVDDNLDLGLLQYHLTGVQRSDN